MPPDPSSPNPPPGKGVERAVQFGIDLVRSARQAARTSAAVPSREQQMARERQAALARHDAALSRHGRRITRLRAHTLIGGAGVVGLGLAATQAGSPTESVILAGVAAGSGLFGFRARRRANQLQMHPPVPQLPPPPPVRLPPGATGAPEADRVAAALLNLYDVIPAVGRLAPEAGTELWTVVSEVEPLLRGQVDRLASLDRIATEMPGSRPAQAALRASREILGRLHAGADALEELISAAVGMLAAPDLSDAVPDLLGPAITSLEAFAHGLYVADGVRLEGR